MLPCIPLSTRPAMMVPGAMVPRPAMPRTGCQPGIPPELDDGVACTTDSCDEENNVAVHTPVNSACDDGAWCNGAETCDAEEGCQPGIPPELDDGVACTTDSCDEENKRCRAYPCQLGLR